MLSFSLSRSRKARIVFSVSGLVCRRRVIFSVIFLVMAGLFFRGVYDISMFFDWIWFISLPIDANAEFSVDDYKVESVRSQWGGSKMSRTKNVSNGSDNMRCDEDEICNSAEVVKIIGNLVQLHKLEGALLIHLERRARELEEGGVAAGAGGEAGERQR